MKVRHHFFSAIGNCFLLQKSTACTDAQLSRSAIHGAEQKLRNARNLNARVHEAHFCSCLKHEESRR